MISGFLCGVNEVFVLLGCYAAYIGSYLPINWGKLSAPSSRVNQSVLLGLLDLEDETDM